MTLATVSGSTPETESFLSATSVHGRCGYFLMVIQETTTFFFKKKHLNVFNHKNNLYICGVML